MPRTFVPGTILLAALLAGCWSADRPAVESTTVNAGPTAIAPPINLAGRWTLSSAGAGSCAMTFSVQPEAIEGTIAPAGGCPFSFFTSRKWTTARQASPFAITTARRWRNCRLPGRIASKARPVPARISCCRDNSGADGDRSDVASPLRQLEECGGFSYRSSEHGTHGDVRNQLSGPGSI
jgi:hypothetical protein